VLISIHRKEDAYPGPRAEVHENFDRYIIEYYSHTGALLEKQEVLNKPASQVQRIAENWVHGIKLLNES
jgi:hypothetical protein